MTRNQDKDFKWFQSNREEIYNHIDKIYDDFEKEPMVEQLNNECIRLRKELEEIKSRTCENCKYLYIDYGRQACKQEMPVWNLSNGCDAFERKE